MKSLALIIAFLLLFAAEILHIYFIMPFPGSQQSNTIDFAYWLDRNILWVRIIGLVVVIYVAASIFKNKKKLPKVLTSVVFILYGIIFFFFNFKFKADKMFYQPQEKLFATAQTDSTTRTKLIIGVDINHQAKAYPIEVIGYHHQVKDTVGGKPIIVTYCTVCRTGRVYSPMVNGKMETFRLVGMDHFNAMFEDATTKSWWRQESGEAITGPLKGTRLQEIPSAQMDLQDWIDLHPNSMVLQPDNNFTVKYDSLKGYDEGTITGDLEHRDTASWQKKSWVVGVTVNKQSKAYDWNELIKKRIIEDSFADTKLLVTIASNNRTFYVLNRSINNQTLDFYIDSTNTITDKQTHSKWNANGKCIDGSFKNEQLQMLQSYQEFWHSWKQFHPQNRI